ncbi:MAG: TetR/AcrR family transcriptional regulator [Candidatus Sericytochromatia bacterium]
MEKREARQQEIVALTAAYILEKGLYDLSLRPLAEHVGTSDRMLLHYFSSKEALVRAALTYLLDAALAAVSERMPTQYTLPEFLQLLPTLLKDPDLQPLFKVWIELASYQSRLELDAAYKQKMAEMVKSWIVQSLDLRTLQDATGVSDFLFVMLEGMLLLNAYALEDVITGAQQWALQHLGGRP